MEGYWGCDEWPSPREERAQRIMDAQQINQIETEHERRVAAEVEKNDGNDIFRKGIGQQ